MRNENSSPLSKSYATLRNMTPLATENRLLVAFGRAAVKAQEMEMLLKETLIVVEVASNAKNRSLDDISKEIDRLTLGQLKGRFLKTICEITEPLFLEKWNRINQERNFLMHRFFRMFPLSGSPEIQLRAAERLAMINQTLDFGNRQLNTMRYLGLKQRNLKPARVRELMGLAAEVRKKWTLSE